MRRLEFRLLWGLAALALVPVVFYGLPAAWSESSPPAVKQRMLPPAAPEHRRRQLSTASELAADLADVVAYLEAGQAYFRAYAKGSHDAEENAAFLKFLEVFEKEVAVAKKEVRALATWIGTQSSLDQGADTASP